MVPFLIIKYMNYRKNKNQNCIIKSRQFSEISSVTISSARADSNSFLQVCLFASREGNEHLFLTIVSSTGTNNIVLSFIHAHFDNIHYICVCRWNRMRSASVLPLSLNDRNENQYVYKEIHPYLTVIELKIA